jgi:hypothetical protein
MSLEFVLPMSLEDSVTYVPVWFTLSDSSRATDIDCYRLRSMRL